MGHNLDTLESEIWMSEPDLDLWFWLIENEWRASETKLEPFMIRSIMEASHIIYEGNAQKCSTFLGGFEAGYRYAKEKENVNPCT